MAFSGITITKFIGGNHGLQVGYNSGSIESHFHVAERPETPPQPSCFVPFRRDPDFVDRAVPLLDQIRERCSVPASRVALVGIGGVGKSQLAIEYCYHTVERSPETWVLWVHASNTARLEQSFWDIADLVKVRGRKDPQADVFKLVHDWLRDERNGPWLLVLDSADDAAVLSSRPGDNQASQPDNDSRNNSSDGSIALQQHLSRYLPPTRHGCVLVTSRTRRAAMQIVEDSDIILIEPMENVAARALLHKKLGDKVDRANKDDSIAELAAALDYMPLALVQAAAYIRQRAPRYSLQQYLAEYRQSDSRKISLLNQEAGHLRRDVAASNAILLTWQISFDRIRSTRQSAADLLSLMSFFDRQGIPEYVLWNSTTYQNDKEDDLGRNIVIDGDCDDMNDKIHDAYDSESGSSLGDKFDDDIELLKEYCLISGGLDERTLEMHSLVQLAVRTWLNTHGLLGQWRESFIHCLYMDFPTGHFSEWAKCQTLFPHVRLAAAQRPEGLDSMEEWVLLRPKAAGKRSKRLSSIEEWALLLSKAAGYAILRGNGADAEILLSNSMQTTKDVFGLESEEFLNNMGLMGLVYSQRDQWEKAEKLFNEVTETCKKKFGAESQEVLVSMTNLASTYKGQNLWAKAEKLEEEVMEIRRRVLGREHSDTLFTMANLAWTYNKQGRFKEAKKLERQVATARNRMLDMNRAPSTITMGTHAIT